MRVRNTCFRSIHRYDLDKLFRFRNVKKYFQTRIILQAANSIKKLRWLQKVDYNLVFELILTDCFSRLTTAIFIFFILQLLIPMLKTCQFSRVEHLLEAISTPEGRLPVIRIALMSGRFDEVDCARLKENQVENQILSALPDFFRKSIAHLQGHSFLILEQLIIWNRLDYLSEILKIPKLFEVFSRRLFEGVIIDYARKAVEVTVVKSSRSGSIIVENGRLRRNTSDSDKTDSSYIVPPTTPSRNDWTNDSLINNCMICREKFGIVSSRQRLCQTLLPPFQLWVLNSRYL